MTTPQTPAADETPASVPAEGTAPGALHPAHPDLVAVKEALDKSTGDGRDLATAQELAKAYVEAHPDEFTEFQSWGTDDEARARTVQAVEVFRAAGMADAQWRAEVWHLFSWQPPNIGGTFQPSVRNLLPNTETAPAPSTGSAAR